MNSVPDRISLNLQWPMNRDVSGEPTSPVPRKHDLASLLHPTPADDFFAHHWEQGPFLVQHRGEDYYRGLLTNRDLEEIISHSDVRYPAIRLAKDGRYYPPESYTKDLQVGLLTFHGVADLDRIAAEYAKGATITLPALHLTWLPLRELCARLEQQLDHSIHANVYVTPGQCAGFPPHYDTHDILVLQIAGRKRWLIDEPTIKLPHDSQGFKPEGFTPGPRLAEIELAAGDLLYLPRGYVHSTTTSRCHSAHITIGINIYSWVDVVRDIVPFCAESEEFRRALPVGFASRAELRPAMKEQLLRMLPQLSTNNDCDRLLDALIRGVVGYKISIPHRFRADAVVVSPDSLLKAPEQQLYAVEYLSAGARLTFQGRTYMFPPNLAPTLSAMCSHAAFRAKDLTDGLGTDGVLGFARYLQSVGFLSSAD
jgi:ribosomal protein L16 Arg81 hydroxylase